MRPIEIKDYDCYYTELLSVLTGAEEDKVLEREVFEDIVRNLGTHHQIWVMERQGRIIATITLIVERKLIHGGSSVLHVEDVIVHPDYQKQGIGRKLIQKAMEVAENEECYKIILDCSDTNASFYEACNFQKKQVQMSWYAGKK